MANAIAIPRMNFACVAALLIVVQGSGALKCAPCSCNCTNSQERNPLIFWTIIPGTIHDGEFTKTNTESESLKMIESLAKKTSHENTVTVDYKSSVSAVLKVFDVSAGLSTGFKHFTSTSTDAFTSEEKQMANQMTATYKVPAGEVFASIAEMKMFAYSSADGNKHRLVLPTGQLYIGTTNKEKLENQIMDDTFTGLARRWGLTTNTRQQLQDSIAANFPTVDAEAKAVTKKFIEFPRLDTYYRIFNTAYPGVRIGMSSSSGAVGCYTGYDGVKDQLWRFEKTDTNAYLIYNKYYEHSRLVNKRPIWFNKERPWELHTFSGKIYNDQKFKIEVVRENEVRIINAATGRLLINCGFRMPGEGSGLISANDDQQIWELRAE